jgi:hypothetical protein
LFISFGLSVNAQINRGTPELNALEKKELGIALHNTHQKIVRRSS